MNLLYLIAALLIGHALADYPLQGDFLSKGKNPFNPLPGVPWGWCMGAHAAINAAFVWWITDNIGFGLAEFVFHWRIDYAKCKGEIGYNTDQVLHIVCKLVWVALLFVIR